MKYKFKVPPPQDVAEAIERHQSQQQSLRAHPEQFLRQSVKRELSASPQKSAKRVKLEVKYQRAATTLSIAFNFINTILNLSDWLY